MESLTIYLFIFTLQMFITSALLFSNIASSSDDVDRVLDLMWLETLNSVFCRMAGMIAEIR